MIQHVCGVCNLVRWRFRMASHTDLISFVLRIVGFVILSQLYTNVCTKTQLTSFEPEPKTARPNCKPMNHTRASHTLSAGGSGCGSGQTTRQLCVFAHVRLHSTCTTGFLQFTSNYTRVYEIRVRGGWPDGRPAGGAGVKRGGGS